MLMTPGKGILHGYDDKRGNLSHKKIKNVDVAPKYLIEDNHEAIIDKATFELAQKIRADRARARIGQDQNRGKYANQYPFTFMLICNRCGRTLKRRYWNYGTGAQRVMQQCGNYLTGKDLCDAKAVYQDVLEGATLQMLNEFFISKRNCTGIIRDIINKNITITDAERKINNVKSTIQEKEQLINNLIDIKVKNPTFDDTTFSTKYNEITYEIKQLNEELNVLEKVHLYEYDKTIRLNKIEQFIKSQDEHITELTTDILKTFIYKIIVVERDEVVFCIDSTEGYTDVEFIERTF